jgi:hypothetical protein
LPSRKPCGLASPHAPRRDTRDRFAGCDVACYDRTSADESLGPDADATENNDAGAERGPPLDDDTLELPVALALKKPCSGRRARDLVVDEQDSVPDENLVLDLDAVADQGVALNLAVRADDRAPLDLDKRADPAVVTDRTAVQVRERVDDDAFAERDIVDQPVWRIVDRDAVQRTPPASGIVATPAAADRSSASSGSLKSRDASLIGVAKITAPRLCAVPGGATLCREPSSVEAGAAAPRSKARSSPAQADDVYSAAPSKRPEPSPRIFYLRLRSTAWTDDDDVAGAGRPQCVRVASPGELELRAPRVRARAWRSPSN